MGVSAQAVSKWEGGKNLPDIDMFRELAWLFHMTIDSIVEGDLLFAQKSNQKGLPTNVEALFPDAEVLCNLIYINSPRDLIFWRKTCGDYANIVGFPDNTGAKHRLVGAHVLAIRKTASDADKAIAAEFAKMLLSYEVQHKMTRSPNFHLSVRTDVLEEQIHSVKKGDQVAIAHFGPEYLGFYLEEPDNEENGRVLQLLYG